MPAALTLILPIVARRGPLLWGLIHLLFVVVQLAAGGAPVTPAPTVPVVLLTGALGLVDTHVRGEQLLWANLGVSADVLVTGYVAFAIAAESLRLVVMR